MSVRVLCLGNELLADDALGIRVAEHIRRLRLNDVEVVDAAVSGFNLIDYILNANRLVVVDTMMTGSVPAGTVRVFRAEDLCVTPGGSPHYIGLFEAIAAGKKLLLPVPDEVVIVTVEAADCTTVGGPMAPAVEASIPAVLDEVRKHLSALDA